MQFGVARESVHARCRGTRFKRGAQFDASKSEFIFYFG